MPFLQVGSMRIVRTKDPTGGWSRLKSRSRELHYGDDAVIINGVFESKDAVQVAANKGLNDR